MKFIYLTVALLTSFDCFAVEQSLCEQKIDIQLLAFHNVRHDSANADVSEIRSLIKVIQKECFSFANGIAKINSGIDDDFTNLHLTLYSEDYLSFIENFKEIDNDLLNSLFNWSLLIADKKFYVFLLGRKANINAMDKDGNNSLMQCIFNECNTEAIRFLIENGADVNRESKSGFNALMIALMYQRNNVVHLISENGLELNIEEYSLKDKMLLLIKSLEDTELKSSLLSQITK